MTKCYFLLALLLTAQATLIRRQLGLASHQGPGLETWTEETEIICGEDATLGEVCYMYDDKSGMYVEYDEQDSTRFVLVDEVPDWVETPNPAVEVWYDEVT